MNQTECENEFVAARLCGTYISKHKSVHERAISVYLFLNSCHQVGFSLKTVVSQLKGRREIFNLRILFLTLCFVVMTLETLPNQQNYESSL